MTWKELILDDLEAHWQPVRSAILATDGLLAIELFIEITETNEYIVPR